MASNFNGDPEDGSSQDSLKPPPRSKSRTKSLDELVAKLEEQNRLLSSDSKAKTTIPDSPSLGLGTKRWSACSVGSNSIDTSTSDSPETPENYDEVCGEADTYHQWGQLIANWSDAQRKKPRIVRDMVRRGVPNALRGMVWQLLCEARDFPLRDQYPQLIKSNSACERMIKRDIARTFPDHSFFKDKDGIGQGTLFNVIKAYSIWDKEVGYCQGSAFIVGILLMQMPEEDAFCVFVKLMQDYRMREIFKPTMAELGLCIFQLESMLQESLPLLFSHFQAQGFHTAMCASAWFLTLCASVFPLNAAFRIMDVFICEGREGLFRVILAMLTLGQEEILELDIEGMLKYFQKTMPEKYEKDMNVLMRAAAEVKVSSKKLKRLEKEYTRVKHVEAEDNEELRRLKTENRLLLQRIDELEEEGANLADRLIQDEVPGSGSSQGRGARLVLASANDLNDNFEISGQLREMTQQLKNVREQLREKDGQLKERNGQLREMTQELTNAHDQLQERDGQLSERTQQLTNVQGQLQERDGQLSERTQQFTNVQGQLQEREGQLIERTQQLTNVQGQLQERDGQLSERTQQLTNVQGQLQERDGRLREKDAQVMQINQQLTIVRGQLQEKDEEVSSLQERVRARDQEVFELETSLSTAQQTLQEHSRQQTPDWVISRDQIQMTEKCLGSGGWGKVVEGKYCGCTVAIKQIYEVLLKSSPYYRELFEREMNIASRCRHPCLLQFIGATDDEESPLFVTELMETSLRKLVEKRPLSRSETSVISLDVARALNYLHLKKPRPIIHRDISSANVLLWRQNDQWRGKVSDYGAANFTKATMTACPGAEIYSAPEAFTEHQNLKVDVYSFGVLLCEMCTGILPDRDRREEQVARVTDRVFRTVIRRCLQRDPEARPSMEEIISELEKLV